MTIADIFAYGGYRRPRLLVALLRQYLFDPGDHLVGRLLRRHAVLGDARGRAAPDILGVDDRELPVVDEREEHEALRDLLLHRLAVRVLAVGPEWRDRSALRHRHPPAERPLDERLEVVLLEQEGEELLAARLVLRVGEDHRGLHGGELRQIPA